MKPFLLSLAFAAVALGAAQAAAEPKAMPEPSIVLVVHGGAGTIDPASMTPEKERAYREGLEAGLRAGHAILKRGGRSLEAVEAAVLVLEDNPLFNAGRGAVFTRDATHELDASIMDGKTLQAGAVAGLTRVRHPIAAARAVMEKSPHVMMAGAGAEAFARENKLELVEPSFFNTPERREALRRVQEKVEQGAGGGKKEMVSDEDRHGTVGAVALDAEGNLAAATSTGGMTNKRPGRIGDSPVLGSGTYASNESCAVSATGDGEYFIRAVAAYDVAARMQYAGTPLAEAARAVIEEVGRLGGTGGLIALDAKGNIAMPFNTNGMYRGSIDASGKITTAIYR